MGRTVSTDPFAMVIALRPVSLNRRRNAKYERTLSEAALAVFPDGPMVEDPLYARIVWFHQKPTTQDVDNIVKPILDALKGIVFEDDFRVAQCLSTRIDLRLGYTLSSGNIQSEIVDELEDLIQSEDNILYIEVGQLVGQQVAFGPIEGGAQ